MNILKVTAVGAVALTLLGCQPGAGPKETWGGLGGAALGGLAGSAIGGGTGRIAAIGAGVLLGGLIGSEIGRSLDNRDRALLQDRTQYALANGQSGRAVEWRNPDSGNYGTVVPQRAYEDRGTYCREYTQTINVGGRTERAYGTACRQPDGSWQIVNS